MASSGMAGREGWAWQSTQWPFLHTDWEEDKEEGGSQALGALPSPEELEVSS